MQVRQVLSADTKLGEGVLWDTARQIVWFVDIKRNRLWHYDPATGSNTHSEAPAQIGWAIPAENGLLLCGLKDGLYTFDPETEVFDKIGPVPGEPATNRLNDACTDPWGRVWFGSMDDSEQNASGKFYVYDQGDIRAAGPSGITITNGPAVNAQGDRIYFTDTTAQKIMVADLTAAGVGEARPFADTGALFPDAYPDGPVVDAEDHVWTGLYLGSQVARFTPDGKLDQTIEMPARDITKMAFGGVDLRTAYVTSAIKNMGAADMAEYPQAGSLFAFDAPVAGFDQARAKL
ncbi:SMP-30/gluconolactonase/LRE family protein [Altererythrobacter luteolus]|uniref:SMP-30/gluconolactonase/LRE family protein n=1 Tax=Pontixanthobacter luteolus TaxID=295089 RepID=A0A6I4V3G2_9SPHN|nr:SMP-30/gluconolactonase/LRE family protein [Pontixanthobacter luteolus]MXP48248.1 SMP-30/gluconolactonase/LRE family protein [Pontixanthobacter luteolus]